MMAMWFVTKVSYKLRSPFTKIIIFLLFYSQFEQNFHQNDATVADNTSDDLKSVGQDHIS